MKKSLRQLELGGMDTRYSISIIHCPIVQTPGGAASFEHVACMLSLQRFNQDY